MLIKNTIKEELKNKDSLIKLRYASSRLTFILVALLFFTSFFLYWAWLYTSFFESAISILYFLLVISLSFFVYFFILNKFKKQITWVKNYILIIILLILTVVLLIPMFVKHIYL